MSAWKHPPRPSRESQWQSICKMALWFPALFIFMALLIAAFAPAIAAVEGNYIHTECRNDPAC